MYLVFEILIKGEGMRFLLLSIFIIGFVHRAQAAKQFCYEASKGERICLDKDIKELIDGEIVELSSLRRNGTYVKFPDKRLQACSQPREGARVCSTYTKIILQKLYLDASEVIPGRIYDRFSIYRDASVIFK